MPEGFSAFRRSSSFFCHSERAFGRGRIPTMKVIRKLYLISQYSHLNSIITRDSSLRSEWHAGRIFGIPKEFFLFLSFWTSFWARKNPYNEGNPETISHISILTSQFYHYARFFTAFRMTCQESFLGNPTNINPETISHISILTSQFYHYAGFFTIFQNDMPEGFSAFRRSSSFFCHSERAFGRGRIPTMKVIRKLYLISQYSHLNSIITRDSSLSFRMTCRESFPPMSTQDSSLSFRMTDQGYFLGNPTNINPETISHISILTSQFYHYARFFTTFRMTYRESFPPMSTQDSSLSFRMTDQGCFLGNPTNINPETLSHISILTSQFYHYAGSFTTFRMT